MLPDINQKQTQAAVKRNQSRIVDLLKWRPEQYSTFMYDCGLEFLVAYLGNDEEAINLLTPKEEFWIWWKNLFNLRDESFIREWDGMEDAISTADLYQLYRDLHNPKVLACEIHPPRYVYGRAFTQIEMASA